MPATPALTDAESAAVKRIIAAPEAWSRRDAFPDPAAVESLEAAGVVEPWERTDYRAVCLTAWGAALFAVEIEELDHSATIETEDGREVRAAEMPYWRQADSRPWSEREAVPYHSPRHPREVPLILAGLLLADTRPGPVEELVLRDEYSGEPVLLFGRTVPVDPRVKGKRRRA